MKLVFSRWPQTRDELWDFVLTVWGIAIPRVQVCDDHTAPFEAFAQAYFAEEPVTVWKASRGFGGKSYLLSLLTLTEAVTLCADVNLLGGSGAQSQNIHDHTAALWLQPLAPTHLLFRDPGAFVTRLTNSSTIKALMASSKSVRGPHPQRLRLDEIDEMELSILEAAQGQPMEKIKNGKMVNVQTVMCVAGWTKVMTKQGEIPITAVTTDDEVWTRSGWQPVRSVVMSGHKEVVDVVLSNGRTLTCTDDHRLATPDGWTTPAALEACLDDPALLRLVPAVLLSSPDSVADAALSPLAVGAQVLGGVGMPLRAMGLASVHGRRCFTPEDVRLGSDFFQVPGIDASTVAAQMVEAHHHIGIDQADVRPAMNGASVVTPVHVPVASAGAALPDPAHRSEWSLGLDRVSQEPVFVVDIVRRHVILPVFDLVAAGEFTAEGIIIHNSSTHQYPDSTMTEVLKRAHEKGWPVHTWCYRESMGTDTDPGWLSKGMVETKRKEVSAAMWDIEYDLQEPSIEGRAIDSDAVDRYFSMTPTVPGEMGKEYRFAKPEPGGKYITGVDWAKSKDWTVIATFRVDVRPWQVVAWARTGRLPWPIMISHVEKRLKGDKSRNLDGYGGTLYHDATGLGAVVHDMLNYDERSTTGLVLVGRDREMLFNDYISAIENDEVRSPHVEFAYGEHRYVTLEDLYKSSGHPPDSFVAGALAWAGRNKDVPVVQPGSVTRAESPNLTTVPSRSDVIGVPLD